MPTPPDLAALVSRDRLAEDLWTLAREPSPTGWERKAALLFADLLSSAGAAVEVDETIPESPSVIGRLKGNAPGPTLQLAGHVDHIDVPHPPPARTAEGISARGAADMKNGLAVMLETVRLMAGSGRGFPGSLLVTVYGRHEAPVGHGEGLEGLLGRGVRGDAALVLEGPPERAVVCGKGQSIWNLTVRGDWDPCHENMRSPRTDDLLTAALDLARELRAHRDRLAAIAPAHPLLGTESVFVGQLHYGDFYNRAPSVCALQGTWRWHPDKRFAQAQAELHDVVRRVVLPAWITVEESWTFVGESFSVDPEHPVVRSNRVAYRRIHGRTLPLAGTYSVLDTSRLVPGGVPTVPIDCHGETGHADREWVRLDRLEDACRLTLLTAQVYLGGGPDAGETP